MTHVPHELAEEFPNKIEMMARLREENGHFARLYEEYHQVNRAVHRAETLIEPITPEAEEELRRQRLRLKDEIWAIIRAAECAEGAGG